MHQSPTTFEHIMSKKNKQQTNNYKTFKQLFHNKQQTLISSKKIFQNISYMYKANRHVESTVHAAVMLKKRVNKHIWDPLTNIQIKLISFKQTAGSTQQMNEGRPS